MQTMTSTRLILTSLTFVVVSLSKAQTLPSNKEKTDSTVILFNDQSYKLTLHIFDAEIADGDQKNATLTLNYSTNTSSKIIFRDSLFCLHPWMRFEDFNNDKVKDVLVFNTSSARSNWSHYLYIVDNKKSPIDICKKILNPSKS